MSRKIQHYSGKESIWCYYIPNEKNPCGCGSNCFHYEQDTKTGEVYAVCNACNTDIYQPYEEHKQDLLSKGDWKEIKS